MSAKKTQLWCEKYRPQKIDDIIFKNPETKKQFKSMVKNRNIPNLLFAGAQGTGKTTLSKALVKELGVHEADVIRINASSENGIDVMRERIERFASTMPLGEFKVVQLEEFNRLSPAAQEGLRMVIEDNSDTCRFITTTNYLNKVIPSLKSRFQEHMFLTPDFDQVLEYAALILSEENIDVDDVELFEKIIRSAYPDIRKVVQLLQQYSHNGKLVKPDGDNSVSEDYKLKLLELIEQDDYSLMKQLVCQQIAPEEYDEVYNFLYSNIHKGKKFKNSLENQQTAIVMIADRLYKHAFVAHPHINLDALFIELEKL